MNADRAMLNVMTQSLVSSVLRPGPTEFVQTVIWGERSLSRRALSAFIKCQRGPKRQAAARRTIATEIRHWIQFYKSHPEIE